MVDEFAAALERKNSHLLNDPIQVDELESFESSKTETGLYKYGAPVGRHDDTVIANLIAFHALKSRDFSDLTDSSTVGKSPEKVELDAYNAEWVERMKSLREQTFPPDAVDDFLNEGVYA